jgi:hypothetical protein
VPLRSDIVSSAALVLATFLVHGPTLGGFFLADDFTIISSFWNEGAGHLLRLLVSDEIGGSWAERFIRPGRIWSLALDKALWGLSPFGFHLTNLLLHAAAALGIFVLVRRLGGRGLPAFIGSLAFIAHPFNLEVAAWITARDESLSAAALLFALFSYLRAADRPRPLPARGASVVLFALSLFTKEYALVFPLALGLLPLAGVGSLRRAARDSLPYLGVIALFLGLRWFAFGHPLGGYGREEEGFGAGHATLRGDLFWIAVKSFARDLVAPATARPYLGAFALLCAMGLALGGRDGKGARRPRRLIYWAAVWPLLFLLPTHNLVYTSRHLYLAFAGMAVAFGLSISGPAFRARRAVELAAAVSLTLLLLPPTLRQEERFARMALMTRVSLEQVESFSRTLADGDVLVLVGMPAHVTPPWGFGWSLSDALAPPFISEKLDDRLTVVTRKVWREEAWQTYRTQYPGRTIRVLIWDPDRLRMTIARESGT